MEYETAEKLIKRGALTVGIVAVLGIGWVCGTETISQGHVGVEYSRQDGVQDKVLSQGLHFVNPMNRITEYPVSTETVEYEDLALTTKDGKPLSVTITYDYSNESSLTPKIYDKFKGSKPEVIEDTWLKARLRDSALAVTSKYTILEVFQKHEEIQTEVHDNFVKSVKGMGFNVENVVFGTPKADDATKRAIQAVVDKQQELEALKIETSKAQEKAKAKQITAQGEAKAKVIKAEGESKANKLLEKSLTNDVLESQKIEKWNGVNSSTVLGNGTGVNVNMK